MPEHSADNRLTLRLCPEERAAIETISAKLASPIRRPASPSDAVRAALLFTAATLPAAVPSVATNA